MNFKMNQHKTTHNWNYLHQQDLQNN